MFRIKKDDWEDVLHWMGKMLGEERSDLQKGCLVQKVCDERDMQRGQKNGTGTGNKPLEKLGKR